MKYLRNDKGVALITVIIAMVVAMTLGTAVLTLMRSDVLLAEKQEERLQAQYIARAGADAAAKKVQDNPEDYYDTGFTSESLPSQTMGEGAFSALIKRAAGPTGTVAVESTGTVGDTSETVTLTLTKGSYTTLFNGIRHISPQEFDLGAMAISWEPGSTVHIEANVDDPETEIELSDNHPDNEEDAENGDIIKSANYESAGNIVLPEDYELFDGTMEPDPEDASNTIITGDIYIETLEKANNDLITFDTQGGQQMVVVDDLIINGPHGEIIIQGGGSVHLYITSSGDIQTPVTMNADDPAYLFIYVADGKELSLSANGTVSAYIAAPNATIRIQSNDTTVNGAIIGNIIHRNSSQGPLGKFHFVPLPDDEDGEGFLTYVRNYYSN